MMESVSCRGCGASLSLSMIDLGSMPLANAIVEPADFGKPEPAYPLHVMVCETCWLVQLERTVPPQAMFGNYSYFSSVSSSWNDHARRFVESAVKRFELNQNSFVVEIASNDGYLLQHVQGRGIPCLGIEPAENIAAAAQAAGVPTETAFFDSDLAERVRARLGCADLIVANNVLAHVPDLHSFLSGISRLLSPEGVVSIEVPHLLNLLQERQFDTIYHEHVFYFSLIAIERVAATHDLEIIDVEELPTHGGSLRVYLCHKTSGEIRGSTVQAIRDRERAAGLEQSQTYRHFGLAADKVRTGLKRFVGDVRVQGRQIVGYGAAAKGSTLLNSCGLGVEDIGFVADLSSHKQGRWMPGCRIPIVPPSRIAETRPDYVFILPWNLADEIAESLSFISDWNGQFVTAIPELRVVPPGAINRQARGPSDAIQRI